MKMLTYLRLDRPSTPSQFSDTGNEVVHLRFDLDRKSDHWLVDCASAFAWSTERVGRVSRRVFAGEGLAIFEFESEVDADAFKGQFRLNVSERSTAPAWMGPLLNDRTARRNPGSDCEATSKE